MSDRALFARPRIFEPMALADDLFFMAHTPTGAPRLGPRCLGFGLVGALLAELVLVGRLVVCEGKTRVVDEADLHCQKPVALDPLSAEVLHQLQSQWLHRDLHDWLAHLAGDAEARVGRRLAVAGLVRRQRTLLGAVRWRPVDVNTDAVAQSRLRADVLSGTRLSSSDAVLAGLILAMHLDRHVFWGISDHDRTYLQSKIRALDESFRQLISVVEESVTGAVLAGRT